MISIALILIFWMINLLIGLSMDEKNRGVFGDMFGAVNALFSGLAFAGIIISLYMQQSELKLQRKELKLQRKELKNTNNEFHIQNQTMELQKFENTFFNMLSIHHQIVGDIDYYIDSIYKFNNISFKWFFGKTINNTENISKSRDVFKNSYRMLGLFMKNELFDSNKIGATDEQVFAQFKIFDATTTDTITSNGISQNTRINKIYKQIYSKFDTDFGHYFRNLYRIVKTIDSRQFVEDAIEDYKIKYNYTSILRSQLSDVELQWLFFNCLSEYGYKKFKPLIEKYSLLKNLNKNEQAIKYYSKFYSETSFVNPSTNEEILVLLQTDLHNNPLFIPKYSNFKIIFENDRTVDDLYI
jgi:hypothetical protein